MYTDTEFQKTTFRQNVRRNWIAKMDDFKTKLSLNTFTIWTTETLNKCNFAGGATSSLTETWQRRLSAGFAIAFGSHSIVLQLKSLLSAWADPNILVSGELSHLATAANKKKSVISDLHWLARSVHCPIKSSVQENLENLGIDLLLFCLTAPGLRNRTGWEGEMCLVEGLGFAGTPL